VDGRPADLVVVGAGAAGLFASLVAAGEGAQVTLVSARPLAETASYWAQGGLAAALSVEDSPERHLQDTLTAGRGLVRESAARVLTDEAPARFRDLEALGVRFDADRHGNVALGLEGGHGLRRVVHAGGSATGRRILRQLSAVVAENPAIEVHEGARAASLVTTTAGRAAGVRLQDGRTLRSRAVLLATGGAAALWSRTTNPPGSFGSGLLLARAAGAALADLEFAQFHPTAVAGVKWREGFLISEAVRGEGATLLDAAGERFVDELAPRDVVAQGIIDAVAAGRGVAAPNGQEGVLLDTPAIDREHGAGFTAARLTYVHNRYLKAGVDITRERVLVYPVLHYRNGGLLIDERASTTLPGLFAAGEITGGVHGANRLMGNSLLDTVVYGRRAGNSAAEAAR
jgi:L-aspartate oxidase